MYTCLYGTLIPKLVAWDEDQHKPILIFEDLSSHFWPAPWDKHNINPIMAQFDLMHNPSAEIESYAEVHGEGGGNWHTVAANPDPFLVLGMVTRDWLDRALPRSIQAAS